VVYLHTDHLGAVVKATDEDRNIVWDAVRKPFGSRYVTVEQVEMPLGFPGQYFDNESGNYYNYFRDYDPATGRYIQSDPIGLAGGLNAYLYANANPNKYIDPTGELFFAPALPAIGAWLGGTGGAVLGWGSIGLGALGAWAAYNESCSEDEPEETPIEELDPLHSEDTIGDRPDLEDLSDEELLNSVRNPKNGDPLRKNTKTGKLMDGNSRAQELKNRANNPDSTISGGDTVPVIPYTPDVSDFWDL
jgi:RHS repeat-associated protein